jgi:hypothetical protein
MSSIHASFAEAADGTRTHDLLHGKQYLRAALPARMRVSRAIRCDRIASDYREFWYRRGNRAGLAESRRPDAVVLSKPTPTAEKDARQSGHGHATPASKDGQRRRTGLQAPTNQHAAPRGARLITDIGRVPGNASAVATSSNPSCR